MVVTDYSANDIEQPNVMVPAGGKKAGKETRADRKRRLDELKQKRGALEAENPTITTKVTGETGDIVGEIWYYYDKDGSGTLCKNEIKEYIEDATGVRNFPQHQFDELFKQYDKDGSGNLSKDEVNALVTEVLKMNLTN